MKKTLSIFAALVLLGIFATQVWGQEQNYDFSATAPSGQTLYYKIYNNKVWVTYPCFNTYYDTITFYYGYPEPTGNLVIPSTVTHGGTTYPVTAVAPYAFWYCSGLTSVTIPNSITTIYNESFEYCYGLTSITIPNSITSIFSSAFLGCTGLTSVVWNADSCSVIFFDGYQIFCNCDNLTSFTFSNNVRTIPSYVCYGITSLNSVTIPDSVKTIGDYSFYGCSGLTSVTIPSSVTSIGDYAFNRCSGLTEIHSLSTIAPQLGNSPFSSVPSTIPVYIPCGSSASYYSRWSYFSNFVEDEGFSFTATSANDQQGTVQILTMPTCTSPQAVVYASANSGYHFDHWSDSSTANPYSLTVTDDLNLVAYFAADGGGTEGIDDIDTTGIRIYSEAGRIVVEGTTDEVNVYDMTGRHIQTFKQSSNLTIPAGVYMVKVGTLPARKVVVIR